MCGVDPGCLPSAATQSYFQAVRQSVIYPYWVLVTFFAFPSAKNPIPRKSVTCHNVTSTSHSAESLARHQPLVESPATNHNLGKRVIPGYPPYNTQLEIIMRYNLIFVYPTFTILIASGKPLSGYYVSPDSIMLAMGHGGYNKIYCPTSFPNLVRSKSELESLRENTG